VPESNQTSIALIPPQSSLLQFLVEFYTPLLLQPSEEIGPEIHPSKQSAHSVALITCILQVKKVDPLHFQITPANLAK